MSNAQKPRCPDGMNTPASHLRRRNLRTCGARGTFGLPLVIAFSLTTAAGWRPAGRVNHGVLITPARPLPPVTLPRVSLAPPRPHGTPFRGYWSLCTSATRLRQRLPQALYRDASDALALK